MKIVVASRNPVKINAVREAFRLSFGDRDMELEAVSVPSAVSDQPFSDAETREGARNRADNARAANPGADFYVGLEGGLESLDGNLQAFAWMAVSAANGTTSEVRSVSLPLPPAIKSLLDQGMELGEANDRVFATENSKQGGGAFGLLTHGRYTRESVYTQTLVLALIPFVHPLFMAESP
jgi:inosine/xanthosine triphosphatase